MVNNFGSRILCKGRTGDDVRVRQTLLNHRPGTITGPDIVVDGDFGSQTQAAVRKFQTYFGLTADGQVGRNTFLYLGQATGTAASGRVFGSRHLRIGTSGRDVWILQNRLASTARDYAQALGVPADSIFGRRTQAAVMLFQGDFELTKDGVVGNRTLYQLYLHTFMGGRVLRSDSSAQNQGFDVYFLQKKLTGLGYSPGALDGKFGPRTEAAVRSFQKAVNIAVDGEVGPVTFYHLGLRTTN